MQIDDFLKSFILNAKSKALATYGPNGINVVPVSSIKILDNEIWLINYFMDKTLQNIKENPEVSLVCWLDMMGFQIKGEIEYLENGDKFEKAVTWIKETLPERVVRGLLILKPKEIFDVSPSKNTRDTYKP